MKKIKDRFAREVEEEQMICFELIELIFINKKDDEIRKAEETLENLVCYLLLISRKECIC
jgi:hypothetical protein